MRLGLLVAFVFLASGQAWAAPVQEVRTESDVTAWLVEEHALPLVSVRVLVRDAGSASDPQGKEGRASMVATLLTEGAGTMNAAAFNEALEAHAIRLRFSVDEDGLNATMNAVSEHAEKGIDLMAQALRTPRFDDAALARVRAQYLSSLSQLERDPGYLLSERWHSLLFAGHPYAQPEIGTAASIRRLQKADMKQYVSQHVARDKLLIAVVGDVSADQLREWLDRAFTPLPAKGIEHKLTDAVLPEKAQQEVVESDVPQTLVQFGLAGVPRNDPMFYDAYLMNILLGGSTLNSILGDEIREKHGFAYAISTQLEPMRHAALWSGGFATRNEKVGEALAVVRQTLDRFSREGPKADQLAEAKDYVTGSFVLGLDSNQAVANYLISMQLHELGKDYLEKRNQLMQQVTVDGVKAAADRILKLDRLQVVMVGKPVIATATAGGAP